MTLAQYLAELEQELVAAGEEAESLSFVYRALNQLSFTDFVLKLRAEVSQEDREQLKAIQDQLLAHKPAQYIIGSSDFHGLNLKVDERVLIPRPETEELVELILSENPETSLFVLDIGTGSGAIALALANSRPDWQITASDLSRDALSLAAENAQSCGLSLTFVQSDCLDAIQGKFDIIVSNPPYISEADKDEVGLNVLASEPHMALFAGENGYAIYRKIAEQAGDYLTEKGKIYLEIGYKQGDGVVDLLKQFFPQKRIRVLKDQFGKDRMVAMDNG
ncbi:peptide chain release factor N(5)-glutamine methyltransferase [Streptococcus sp. 27098_8_75]|jgi:protein-(glutamine-N5) methyltransferase, release factor-specific|uniref:peptide chain release factor N(5)-glutamine methyltransferase n=1 Tax=Streptococcus TaxID=1301 RepID=UPI0005F32C21|nr:peptide chain release factor N(5)-glutamine methyltransferase [Streptococcus gordonii]KJU95334.1 HemK protein [Streptococcus gordonii]MCC3174055.1 protein-(glutamine-N5) methyltransferase, release factor-specific [Streptococcus gordonii]MCY7133828.1 peptide chain release factor N(5)-glutamine methyltransferase [Streptococcus gordonii]MCY7142645.1 peptide chain release factor N(5)-glutamine methyltransferase [Streptococcus gordonii]MCY7146079.1 peptide chain release factor N(5)-glutamine met